MVAFPSITATRQHPARPGELVTVYTGSHGYTGVFLDKVFTLGQLWLEIQEVPGRPPLAVMWERIRRIERYKTLIAPRVGAA